MSEEKLASALQRIRALEKMLDARERELRAVQDTLRISSEYLKDVLGAVSDMLLVVDPAGIILTVNRSTLTLLGYEERELLGEELASVAPELKGQRLEMLADAPGGPRRSEVALKSKDEQLIPVLFAISRLRDPVGDVVYVCAGTDIRERLLLEAELRQAQKLESLGQLAAGVAHEINNPLGFVIGNLDYLKEELPSALSEELGDCSTAIAQACEGAMRVRDVVRELLAFSRNDEEEIEPTDVNECLESTLRLAANQIKARACLVRDYGALPPVLGDRSRLGQVFLNLVLNAAQALPEGEATANEIRVTTYLDDAEQVFIEVRDTGPGIAEDIREKIFDPFFTTKPVGEGTGLGLSICHGIVTGLGGEITVDSEVGRGTAVQVRLPALVDASQPEPSPHEKSAEFEVARAKLLIVDDEPLIRAALKRYLVAWFEVEVAENGRQAWEKLEGDVSYDLVLCDLIMPEMTGMELFEAICADSAHLARRFVFITGGAFTQRARDFLERVENTVLYKPFAFRELRDLIAERVG